MITRLLLWLIEWYQHNLSAHKGFHCAHHRLHGGDTCSNAVKSLLVRYGWLNGWPKIKARFKACQAAHQHLHLVPSSDLPCDIACDPGIADCGGGGSTVGKNTCVGPCELIFDWSTASKKTRRRVLCAALTALVFASYWLYGRGVEAVYITELNQQTSLLQRLTQRSSPKLRVMLVASNKKYYSMVNEANLKDGAIRLQFESGPLLYKIDRLEIHDARLQLGSELLVLGQVLAAYPTPGASGQDDRFAYRIKRRWHFW